MVSGDEQLLELLPRRVVHRRPVELVAAHRETLSGGRLDGLRLVDAVGHQIALGDRLGQGVPEGRAIDLEEAEPVPDERAVLGIGQLVGILGDAGCCCQANLDAIEVAEHAAPLPIDAAMTLVGDDQIEVAG
jgi:hypothetical protein